MKKKILIIVFMTIALILTPIYAYAKDIPTLGGPEEFEPTLGKGLTSENNEVDDRYIVITMHANGGHFNLDGNPTEYETVQFRGDAFEERIQPVREGFLFKGWATEEDAIDPDILVGGTNSSMIGTDIYAVWTNKCTIDYQPGGGFVIVDGAVLFRWTDEYDCGTLTFSEVLARDNITATTSNDAVPFKAWYMSTENGDVIVPDDYLINDTLLTVKAAYTMDPTLPVMELDREYTPLVKDGGVFYKFVPEETDVYEILTDGMSYDESVYETCEGEREYGDTCIAPDDLATFIGVLDQDAKMMKSSTALTDNTNSHVVMTLMKGKTYYFQFREMGLYQSYEFTFKIKVRKADSKKVTFHSNRGDETWFDDDVNKKEQMIPFTEGERIDNYSYALTGLNFRDERFLIFAGWSDKADADIEYLVNNELVVENDMDVYAVYVEKNFLTLDANGGYFPLNNGSETFVYSYIVGYPFDPPFEPHIDDQTKKLAGWSKDKNATEPDEDILEGITDCEDLPRTLYAVYSDKVVETFDANGGYFIDDPTVTTYQTTKGKGHIFYGLALFNQNSRMVPLGWNAKTVSGKEEFIPYTPNSYPFYTVDEDVTYTAEWGYKVILDANEGIFPNLNINAVFVVMEAEGLFTLANVGNQLGDAVPDDPNKYFVGWATTPDATEPDVIEGVTKVKGLDRVYAVYKDDTYKFVKGDKSSWIKDSEEGLEFVIKREGDDRDTYSAFTYVKVDDEALDTSKYTRKEGSLILTLKPDYLNTLDEGEHEIAFTFGGTKEVKTTFNITSEEEVPEEETPTPDEPISEDEEKTPITGDNIMLYIYSLIVSSMLLTGTIIFKKKIN